MTLEQLRIFVAVAERQHVTAAAQTLGLTQSAASSAIAALEQRYNTKFFHRVGRSIELTEEGARFLVEARAVLARAAAAEQTLDDLSGLRHGTLRIHASQTSGGYWLPRYLVDFRNLHPGIELQFTIGNTEQVATAVRDGIADIGFIEGAITDASLRIEEVAKDKLLLVVGAQHPWAARKSIQPANLVETSWILREKGSGTRAMFEAALASFHIKSSSLEIVMELASNEAIRSAVIAGKSATVLSASVVVAGLEAGLLHTVKLNLPDRAFYALIHKERYVSRSAQAFLAMIKTPARAKRAS
ncbi:MAG TPA: LysR family transcriptional regulator [Rhizomicrobium sp.]|nr:LysR family transcriptional regulator [Rhizomicrobium sp.]